MTFVPGAECGRNRVSGRLKIASDGCMPMAKVRPRTNPKPLNGTAKHGRCRSLRFVFTPSMLIAQLILQVEQPNPGVKNKQPLLATLADASAAIERGNTTVALNQLSAFQNKVRAQVAPANAALADDLVAIAQQILVAVSGP
jgi:hypothetical protein